MMRAHAQLAAAIGALSIAQAAHAGAQLEPMFWIVFGDGQWHDPSNWDQNRIPFGADTTIFKNEVDYTVFVGAPASAGRIRVRAGNVAFSLASNSLGAVDEEEASVIVGEFDGDMTSMTVRDGRFTTVDTIVALGQGSIASLAVEGAIGRYNPAGATTIGVRGHGTFAVRDGGRATIINPALDTRLGVEAGASGALVLDGPTVRWTQASTLRAGLEGDAEITITGGARLSTADAILADGALSSASVLLGGGASTWIVNGALMMGHGGQAALTIGEHATVSAESLELGPNSMLDITVGEPGGAPGVVVVGTASLGGSLHISLGAESGVLQVGDTFDLLVFADRAGRFDASTLPDLDAGLDLRIRYRPDRVYARVIPAPAAALILPLTLLPRRRR